MQHELLGLMLGLGLRLASGPAGLLCLGYLTQAPYCRLAGDSYTAGAGNTAGKSCKNANAANSNTLLAYGSLAAKALKAEYQVGVLFVAGSTFKTASRCHVSRCGSCVCLAADQHSRHAMCTRRLPCHPLPAVQSHLQMLGWSVATLNIYREA